jgi:ABC transporter DrrB family efflux protein
MNATEMNATEMNATEDRSTGAGRTHGTAISDTLIIAKRNLLRIVRTPQYLVFSSIQPVMFVLLFRYVFGGAIQSPGYQGHYADYLIPGLLVQLTLFGGAATAVGLAEDMQKGMVDRFRSLPMSRGAVLAGRTFADIARSAFVLILLLVVGSLVGFRFHNGFLNGVAALLLAALFGFAFSWFFAFIGMKVKDPETAQVAGFLPIFPLVFAASTFTPIDSFPQPLRVFAKANPVTNAVNAIRSLTQGSAPVTRFIADGKRVMPGTDPQVALVSLQKQADSGRYVIYTLMWCAAIIAVFAFLAIRTYRNSNR